MSIRGNGMPKLSKFQWKYLSYMVPLTHWKHNSRCVKTNLRFTFRGLRILELHTKSGIVDFTRPSPKWGLWKCVTPLYLWSFDLSRSISWIFLACWMFLVVVVVVVEGPVVPHQQNSIDLIDPHSKIAKIDPPSFEAYVITFPMILGITIWGCPKVMEVPPVLIHLNVGFSKTIVSCSTPIYGNLHFLANPSISGPPWWVPLAKEQILMPRNAPAPGDGSDRLCLGKLKPEKPWSQHTYPLVNYHT